MGARGSSWAARRGISALESPEPVPGDAYRDAGRIIDTLICGLYAYLQVSLLLPHVRYEPHPLLENLYPPTYPHRTGGQETRRRLEQSVECSDSLEPLR
jgi:hypothetical protein